MKLNRFFFIPVIMILVSAPCRSSGSIDPDGGQIFEKINHASIDQLLMASRKTRSITSRRIQQVLEYFEKERWTQTGTLLRKIKNEPLFSDYGHYLSGKQQYHLGKADFEQKSWRQALKHFQTALSDLGKVKFVRPETPLTSETDDLLVLVESALAQSQWKLKAYRDAFETFEKAFVRVGRRRLRIVLPVNDLVSYGEFCRQFAQKSCENRVRWLIRTYPEQAKERALLKKAYPKSQDWQLDFPVAETHFGRYYGTDRDQEKINQGFDYYWRGRFSHSARILQEVEQEFPRSKEQARVHFWIGESLRKDDEPLASSIYFKKAMKYSPLSFYSLAASFRIQREPQVYFSATLPEAQDFDEHLTPKDALHLKRAKKLYGEGVYPYAAKEVSQIQLRSFYDDPFLLYLIGIARAGDAHLTVFKLYSELISRKSQVVNDSFQLNATFPKPFWKEIQAVASDVEIDPILILSLIKQESAFRPSIQSGSGASGLMQLMSFTAIDVDSEIYQSELTNPKRNIELGARYLKKVIGQFNGNWAYALAGYNAGPFRMRQWLKQKVQFTSLEEFIETIPYAETKNYVRSIVRNYYWYSYLIDGQKLSNLDLFFTQNELSQN